MVWTQPMTFTAGTVLTAAQMNVHVRDNLMASEVAQIQQAQDYIVSAGYHQLARRQVASQRVLTSETTKSTEYTDLAQASGGTASTTGTVGPMVTVETGSTAWVFLTAFMQGSISLGQVKMGYQISRPAATTTSDAQPEDQEEEDSESGAESGIEVVREPSDTRCIALDGLNAGGGMRRSYVDFLTDLPPGLNTFTCKYRVGSESNTGTFVNRQIIVIPM